MLILLFCCMWTGQMINLNLILLNVFNDFFFQLRPPQPPVYLFVFDVSHNAIETGYLNSVCQSLLDNLDL